MKAIAIYPGQAGSVHLEEMAKSSLDEIPNGRGVLVKVLRVGVDGTDREIYNAEYGNPPEGSKFLVCGHESFGKVEAVGDKVGEFKPDDYVVATVRRPGKSIYDLIGLQDMTTDDVYYEHGINLLHGFLREYYAEDPQFLVKIPQGLKEIAVLLEPLTIAEKAWDQATEIQRRLRVWSPVKAAIMGSGTVGLLATLVLRLRGLDVTVFSKGKKPYHNADLIEQLGARYVSVAETSITDASKPYGPFDLILELTGYSPVAFESMQLVAKNGVLVLGSITGGHREATIPADVINQQFVLGNKLMFGTVNASKHHFEMGVSDMAQSEAEFPGFLKSLLTDPVDGLDNFKDLYDRLINKHDVIKAYLQVATD